MNSCRANVSRRPFPCGCFPQIHSRICVSRFTSHTTFSPLSTSGFALSSDSLTGAGTAKVPVIGILGGIGSGKSSVVGNVTGLTLQIIDADRIGHELLADPDIQSEIRNVFGDGVFSQAGTVDRAALANRVFGESPEHRKALQSLNEILHPAIRQEINTQIDSASRDVDAVILDAALLLEGGWDARCDWLIFIDTPTDLRQQRVRENRGWSAEELERREATQMNPAVKKDRADFVVDNSGSVAQAAEQMKQALTSVLTH